jgi:16S rRNA (cytidine1402-2'-O)-methyltransferase
VRGGHDVAVVTDAGTPGISDPGYPLVLAAHEAAVTVRSVPGPSAVAAALSVAGQPTDRFAFEGFLPSKARARRTRLRQLAADPRTQVIFEAGRRLEAALADCAACLGSDRSATLARELTKQFETVLRASLADLRAAVAADSDQQRGESVLVIAGASARGTSETAAVSLDQALDALLAEVAPARAAAIAARLTGVARREAYERALTRVPDRSS